MMKPAQTTHPGILIPIQRTFIILFLSSLISFSAPVLSNAGEADKILTLMFGAGTSSWTDIEDPTEMIYNGLASVNLPIFTFGKNKNHMFFLTHQSFYESINELVVMPEGIYDYSADQNHAISLDYLGFFEKSSINIHLSGSSESFLNRDSESWQEGLFNRGGIEASINFEKATKGAMVFEEKTITEEMEFINPETEAKETLEFAYTLNKGRMTPEKIKYGLSYNYHDYYNPLAIAEFYEMAFLGSKSHSYHQFKLYFGRDILYSPMISDKKNYNWQKKKSKIAEKKYNKLTKEIEKLKNKLEKAKETKKEKLEAKIQELEEDIESLQKNYMTDYFTKAKKTLMLAETTKFTLSYNLALEYLLYPWQNLVTTTGSTTDNSRNDLRSTVVLNASYFIIPGAAKLFVEGDFLWNLSGQNYYNTSYNVFIPSYYEYTRYGVTAGIKTSSSKPLVPRFSLSCTYRLTDYPGRYIPEAYGYYFFTLLDINYFLVNFRMEFPVNDNIFFMFAATSDTYTMELGDRRLYSDGFKESLSYDADIGFSNYYFFAGVRF